MLVGLFGGFSNSTFGLLGGLLDLRARLSDHDVFGVPLDLTMVADVWADVYDCADLEIAQAIGAPVSLLPSVCLAPVLDECALGATLGTFLCWAIFVVHVWPDTTCGECLDQPSWLSFFDLDCCAFIILSSGPASSGRLGRTWHSDWVSFGLLTTIFTCLDVCPLLGFMSC